LTPNGRLEKRTLPAAFERPAGPTARNVMSKLTLNRRKDPGATKS
jgi:hypothetical protein